MSRPGESVSERDRLIAEMAATLYDSVKMCTEPERVAVKVAREILREVERGQ